MATIAEIQPRPLVIMAAGHGIRSGLPATEHKMLQDVDGESLLGRILQAAVDSPAVGEIILDLNENSREAARKASALMSGLGHLNLSSPNGYLTDFVRWSATFSHQVFIVDSDIFAPAEELRRFFDLAQDPHPDAPALAHTRVNDSNRHDTRSAWVTVDPQRTLLTHARGEGNETPLCTIGLWKSSPDFTNFLAEAQGHGLTSITRGVSDYLAAGKPIISPLVDRAVNVNSPEDLRVARSLAERSLVS